MPGDFVCNENMVWACILDQPVKDDTHAPDYKEVTKNFPYDSLSFSYKQ